MVTIVTVIFAVVAILAIAALAWLGLRHVALRRRFAPVVNVDAELAKVKRALQQLRTEHQGFVEDDTRRRAELNASYQAARTTYERLTQEVALVEENLEDISYGLYKRHYNFDTSEAYKEQLEAIWQQQKSLIKADQAVIAAVEWSVGGSKRDGARMQKQYGKLLLRAFNGECDAAIAKVDWNNVTRMEERIKKAFEAINTLGGVMQISIAKGYFELRLAELRLEYELQQKRHDEQEEQRRIREQMREEEKALREAERAKQEAEAEEARYQKALDKARAELAEAKGEALTELNIKIQQLDQALHKAHEMKDKATSMAQLTRSGHVYIISNVGSLGDNVFKIGMTRRLDPMDRVRELGDASVPFEFDVHAMVYSQDAPALENQFHQFLETQRLNLVNPRKEFFAVAIDELDAFVRQKNLKIELTKLAEAKEYRETIAMRQAKTASAQQAKPPPLPKQFPAQLL